MKLTLIRTTPQEDVRIAAQIRRTHRRNGALILAHVHGVHKQHVMTLRGVSIPQAQHCADCK